MNLASLEQRKVKAQKDMRAILEVAETENRDLNADEQTQFDTLKSSVGTVEKQIENRKFVDDQERRAPAKVTSTKDGSFEERARHFDVCKAIAHKLDPSVDAGFEMEISRETEIRSGRKAQGLMIPNNSLAPQEKRAVISSADGAGLYPETHRGDLFIEALRPNLRVMAAGATVMNDLQGDQVIPRLNQKASSFWVGEHQDVTQSDQVFDDVTLTPKTVGAQVEWSRRMIINGSPQAQQVIQNDLLRVLATAVDAAALAADGTGNQPTGVLNTAGVSNIAFAGPVTFENWLDMVEAVESADAMDDNSTALSLDSVNNSPYSFITSPKVVRQNRTVQMVTAGGTDTVFIQQFPDSLAEYRVRRTSLMPIVGTDASAIFGNWNDLLVGFWTGIDLLINPYADSVYSKGGVLVQAMQDVDVQVRHPESFAIATDIDVS